MVLCYNPLLSGRESCTHTCVQDKERVAAALENPNLMDMVDRCLARSEAALQQEQK